MVRVVRPGHSRPEGPRPFPDGIPSPNVPLVEPLVTRDSSGSTHLRRSSCRAGAPERLSAQSVASEAPGLACAARARDRWARDGQAFAASRSAGERRERASTGASCDQRREQLRRQPLLDDQPAAVRLQRPQPRGVRHPALPAAGHLAPLEQQPGPLHALGVDRTGHPAVPGRAVRPDRVPASYWAGGRSPRTRWARGTPLPRLPQPPPMPPAIPNGGTDSNTCSMRSSGPSA